MSRIARKLRTHSRAVPSPELLNGPALLVGKAWLISRHSLDLGEAYALCVACSASLPAQERAH